MSSSEQRGTKAQALAEHAMRQGFTNWLIVVWEPDDKWVATVNDGFDLKRMELVRDWLTQQLEVEKKFHVEQRS